MAALLLLGSGCASTGAGDDEYHSDLPWSTPEAWEGSPMGMPTQR